MEGRYIKVSFIIIIIIITYWQNGHQYLTLLHHDLPPLAEKMEPPIFTQKPLNKDVKEGSKTRFDVTAKGKPLPDIEW